MHWGPREFYVIMEIFENILRPVDDEEESVIVQISDIPRSKPAVDEGILRTLQGYREQLSDMFYALCT